MAISSTTRSLCNKMVTDYTGLTSPIRQARAAIRQKSSDLEREIRNTIFSETSALDAALQSFEDQLEENLPEDTAQGVQDIKDMIDNCEYLSALNAVSAVAGTALGIYDKIKDLIDDISTSTGEFIPGGIADEINNILNGLQIPFGDEISNLFSKADKLIECLTAFCGGEYPSQISAFTSELNDLYDDMNIVSDPNDSNYTNYDYDALYDKLDLSAEGRENLNKTINKISDGHTAAKDSIDSTIEAVKNTIRAQGIGGL